MSKDYLIDKRSFKVDKNVVKADFNSILLFIRNVLDRKKKKKIYINKFKYRVKSLKKLKLKLKLRVNLRLFLARLVILRNVCYKLGKFLNKYKLYIKFKIFYLNKLIFQFFCFFFFLNIKGINKRFFILKRKFLKYNVKFFNLFKYINFKVSKFFFDSFEESKNYNIYGVQEDVLDCISEKSLNIYCKNDVRFINLFAKIKK